MALGDALALTLQLIALVISGIIIWQMVELQSSGKTYFSATALMWMSVALALFIILGAVSSWMAGRKTKTI